jgi:hypothetical protein
MITGHAELRLELIQNISRFDCQHSAADEELTQSQSATPLCKNCGVVKLPVERQGKGYFNSRAAEANRWLRRQAVKK